MSTPSWAIPGAKVVCVSDNATWEARGWFRKYFVDGPRKNEECTVTGVYLDPRDGWLLKLREYPILVRGRIEGYTIGDFRPLVAHKREAEDRVTFEQWLKTPESAQ